MEVILTKPAFQPKWGELQNLTVLFVIEAAIMFANWS